jgi:hypothetical protein
MLDIFYWYAISITAIFALLFIRWVRNLAIPYLPCLRSWALNHVVYRLLIPSRKWIPRRKWPSITYIEAAALAVYFGANVAGLAIDVPSRADKMLRFGFMSSINMAPLFLGGQTSFVADVLGIPLHIYYLAHHWVGRMVVVQVLVHTGLAISPDEWIWDGKTTVSVTVGSSPCTSQDNSKLNRLRQQLPLSCYHHSTSSEK